MLRRCEYSHDVLPWSVHKLPLHSRLKHYHYFYHYYIIVRQQVHEIYAIRDRALGCRVRA